MKAPTPRHLRSYVAKCLGLKRYLQRPGDGRRQPRIQASVLLWALLAGQILRECSFAAVEALARSSARRALGVSRKIGDAAAPFLKIAGKLMMARTVTRWSTSATMNPTAWLWSG